jgi:transcriptional regulator with XRE-family HTH domain
MIHKGEVIEKAVRASGMSISKVAEKMGKSRRWMYLLFENPNVSTDVILELSKVLHYPFHELLQISEVSEPRPSYGTEKDAEFWKQKYYSLLEECMELLKNK